MNRLVKCTWCLSILVAVALLATLAMAGTAGAAGGGKNGTTLAASKTIEICDLGNGYWRYSGEVAIWDESCNIDAIGLNINDCIETKVGSASFTNLGCENNINGTTTTVPNCSTQQTALTFPYSLDLSPAPTGATIRNHAYVTILNHSSSMGTPFGPEPKATYTGSVPPPACETECGCVLTQGYWQTHTEAWPSGFNPNNPFFSSGLTWYQALTTTPGGNGFYILASQYIPAALNQANGACTPDGIFGTGGIFTQATAWFSSGVTPASCPTQSSCGLQKTWAAILDDYNNGVYEGGPAHCE